MKRTVRHIHADWRAGETGLRPRKHGWLNACAVYPGPYQAAMANLGFQWLLAALNKAGIHAERVVWPEKDVLAEVERETLRTIDSDQPACKANIWFVSISFENDLVHLAGQLRLAGLPLFAEDRSAQDPLIVVGGVVPMLNPEPVAAFADICLLGEGEAVLSPFLTYLQAHNPKNRESFLSGLHAIPGAYVGRFYQSEYHEDGRLAKITATNGFPLPLQAPKEKRIDPSLTRTHLRASEAAFGDALLVETARGCVQRCRFCAAGHLFLPYRPAPPPADALPDLQQTAVGLVGANVSGNPHLDRWLEKCGDKRITLSSVRIDTLSPEQWRTLVKSGLKSLALAPETGSDHLRRVCHKTTTNKQIKAEVETAAKAGILNLKLYFLVGLPRETEADIDAIIELCRQCRDAAMRHWKNIGRAGKLVISVNPFVPKPHTPFQWRPFGDPGKLNAKMKRIKNELGKEANIQVQAESISSATLQAVLSVGDRRVSELIVLADRLGNDRRALRAWSENLSHYLSRPRGIDETLPWDHIDVGLTKQYLKREWEAALSEPNTAE